MKTKIKRHSRSVLSVVLAVCMLVSCMTVGLIATDAAQTSQQSATGAAADEAVAAAIDEAPAQEEGAAQDADESSDIGAANDGAVGASVDSDSVGAADVYGVKGTFNNWSETNKFNADTKQVSIHLNANTTYQFKIYSTYGNGASYGANKNYTGTDSEYYFNTNNSTNATIKTTVEGDYVFKLKREDQGDGAVALAVTYPAAAKTYTITKATTTDGSFTVSKTTATAGTRIDITAKPNRGYEVNTVSVSDGTAVSGTGNNRYFTMPSQNVTVSVTFKTATAYTIKANKVTTGSGTINITLKSGSTAVAAATATTSADATLTAYSGETLVVTASPSSGYQLSTLYANGDYRSSGYSETVNNSIQDIAATFTTKTYTNQYTATLGNTITGNNDLYTKIKATYFDYKTDHEVDGSWIRSIQNQSDRSRYEGTCEPYTKLNTALKNYSSGDVAYPIYFGNFFERDDGYAGVNNSTDSNFKNIVNNSQGLHGDHKAVTGLTGKTLSSNGLPTYYQNGATNENGKEMKLFDKDWLSDSSSSGNGQGVLANIIDAPFPVKKNGDTYIFNSNNGAQNIYFKNLPESPYYDMGMLYLNVENYDGRTGTKWIAYFFEGPDKTGYQKEKFVDMEWLGTSGTKKIWKVPYDGDYKKVKFIRKASDKTSADWSNIQVQTEDITIPEGNNANLLCTMIKWNSYNADSKITTYWESMSGVAQNSAGNTSNITLDYYENSNEVYSPWYHNEGFYPFDWSHRGHQAYDLGFGVAMEIKFTLGPNGCLANGNHQVFEFSGDDDLWVYIDDQLILDLGGDHKMTQGKIDFADKKILGTQTTAVQDGVTRNADNFTLADKAVHTMKLFYLERGMFDSNLKFSFSMYPYDNTYDVEKNADLSELNAGLQNQFSDSFTFRNTAGDGKGASAAYTVYDSASHAVVRTDTTNGNREFTINNGQYASFTNIFTVNEYLSTLESPSGVYQYDTSYQVVDVENNNALVKAGDGENTENFNFLTTLAGADPDLDITHLRAIFTNKLKTQSFMVTKEINGYDDASTAFPFKVEIKMTPSGKEGVVFDTTGLAYKTSLDGYCETHYLGAGGLGEMHEGEFLLFDGIPEGAKVTVYEPTANTTNRTPNAEGDANCYKNVTIQNTNDENHPQHNLRNGTTDQYTDVTIQLNGFDTITIFNEPKNYRMDYKLQTRLYGEKIYKLTGKITPAMVHQSYVEINDTEHTAFLTRKFVSDHIPYESNFMKNLTWSSGNANHDLSKNGFDDYVILTADVSAKSLTVKIDTDGNGSYDKTISGLTCGQSIKDENDEYITGTKENDKPSYWSIHVINADGTKGAFVANCYSPEFNYVAFDNYFVTAVYGKGSGHDLYNKFISATVTDLGITRNHWNDTVSGSNDSSTYYDEYEKEYLTYSWYLANKEYDRLYLDMALAFDHNGKMINTYPEDTVKVGYEILYMKDGNWKLYKDVQIPNAKLDNKNRIHAYYGFANSENNRGLVMGIRAYVDDGVKTYSDIMTFELNTVGSKGLSSAYDLTSPRP